MDLETPPHLRGETFAGNKPVDNQPAGPAPMTADITMVAPELAAGLEFIPDLDFSAGIAPYRGNFAAWDLPPLPEALQAVHCEERLIPGPPGQPDVRVLHYVPPGPARGARPSIPTEARRHCPRPPSRNLIHRP